MQVTTAQQGTTFTLKAESTSDRQLLDALDLQRHIALVSVQRYADSSGFVNDTATVLVDRKSPQALEAQAARELLRTFRELLRLGCTHSALDGHVGSDAADPQAQEQLTAHLEKLQLVLQALRVAVLQQVAVRQNVVSAHGEVSGGEKPILAQAGQEGGAA